MAAVASTFRQVRVSASDAEGIRKALEIAAVALPPDELSQRQLFKQLMPQIKTLKTRGHSLRQVWNVLQTVGFKLELSTVKQYYIEFLEETQEACLRETQRIVGTLQAVERLEGQERAKGTESLAQEVMAWRAQLTANTSSLPAEKLLLERSSGGRVIEGNVAARVGAKQSPRGVDPVEPFVDTTAPNLPFKIEPAPASPAGDLNRKPKSDSFEKNSVASRPVAKAGLEDVQVPVAGVLVCLTVPGARGLVLEPEQEALVPRASAAGAAFWSDATLEHPGIPGLMLTLEQRLYANRLEYSRDGEILEETISELSNRRRWVPKLKGPSTTSRTAGDFVAFRPDTWNKSDG